MNTKAFLASLAVLGVTACGGGGGGGSTGGNSGGGGSVPVAPAASVQGDMLALAPSRGWNYHSTSNGTTVTISLYANPALVNNVRALTAAAVAGSVTTAITTPAAIYSNAVGVLGITEDASANYNVVSEISPGSAAAVPGAPLLVPSSLTTGQTWSPYAGASATVVTVGTMPNAGACPAPTTGAKVRYTYGGFDYTVSYVPGCGITDLLNNYNGVEISLASVGTYASVGQLATARRVETLTLWDTAQSLLGQRRSNMPATKLIRL